MPFHITGHLSHLLSSPPLPRSEYLALERSVKDYTSRLRTDATRYTRLVSWLRPPRRSQLPTSLPFRQVPPLHYTLGPPGSGKTSMVLKDKLNFSIKIK
jgi:type VI protein secretion system component VasK